MKTLVERLDDIQHKQVELDEVQAEVLLNQANIQTKLRELDEVQAEILLQSLNTKKGE